MESEYGHTFATGAILFNHAPDTNTIPVYITNPFPREEERASTSGEGGRSDMITLSSPPSHEYNLLDKSSQNILDALPGVVEELKQSSTDVTKTSIITALKDKGLRFRHAKVKTLLNDFPDFVSLPDSFFEEKATPEANQRKFATALPAIINSLKGDPTPTAIIQRYREDGNQVCTELARASIKAFRDAHDSKNEGESPLTRG